MKCPLALQSGDHRIFNRSVFRFSLPQEDSDVENEMTPPTPPPPRKFNRRGPSFKLACIGKQNSDENPLMKRIAAPLKLAQAQVSVVQCSH